MTGPNFPVPAPVQTAAKAINTSLVLAGGWVALLVTSFADGSVSWDEGGKLIAAAGVAAGSIFATWKTQNKPKGT
jgi:hypothetical protein